MSLSRPEVYAAGMSLPPDVDLASESWWRTEVAAAYDALKAHPPRAIPAYDVRAGFEAKWSARS